MRILREWICRLRGTLHGVRSDSDLERELRLHVELAAEAAQRRGQDSKDAVRAVRTSTAAGRRSNCAGRAV